MEFPKYNQLLIDEAADYALSSGLIIKHESTEGAVIHAPFSLFPSPFPRLAYERGLKIQSIFNKLVHKMSLDDSFIRETMSDLSKVDDFMKRSFDIYNQVYGKRKHNITIGIHRSDYLIHHDPTTGDLSLKQVELNTIAASFASLSSKVSDLHRYLYEKGYYNSNGETTKKYDYSQLPLNESMEAIPKGLAAAHKAFNIQNSVVLMLAQPDERNIFDQRYIQYTLASKYGIKLVRKSLLEIHQNATLDQDQNLVVDGNVVSVCYIRAGYAPSEYHGQDEWDARLKIESSNCVKCPNIAYHLVGSKKVQQVLALPGYLERFFDDENEIQLLRECFTGLYPLDDTELGQKAYKRALDNPEPYVMKPQREGGGNNIYGNDITPYLSKLSNDERKAFILMDLIRTPDVKNVMVRNGKGTVADVVSELGVYGIFVSNGENIILNQECGHLLRTKRSDTTEGGVATGFSVLDSPVLY